MKRETNPAAHDELVTVFDTKDEAEALVVKGLLDSEGIESIIANPEVPQDVLPGVGEIVLRVRPEQAEEARGIITRQRQEMSSEDFSDSDFSEDSESSADLPSRSS